MLIRKGTSDEFILKELALYKPFFDKLKSTYVMLDIGANIGLVTCEAMERVETIYAFEPHPINFAIAQSNVARKLVCSSRIVETANVVLMDIALVSAIADCSIQHSYTTILNARMGENQGAHSLVTARTDRNHVGITVKAMSVELMFNSGIKADAIKIDIEGGEEDIMPIIFKHEQCKLILAEYHPMQWAASKCSGDYDYEFKDMLGLATQHGYKATLLQCDLVYGTYLYLHEKD